MAIFSATCKGAIARSADTLLTGLNVMSNPATAAELGRELRATHPDSSRVSSGARPMASVNIRVATRVRIRARMPSGIAVER